MKLIALNPRKKKPARRKKTGGRKKTPAKRKAVKRTAKPKGASMAKRRKRKAAPKRRRARRNPSVKRTVRRARRAVGVLGPVEGAAKSLLPMLAGAMSAKVVQRKFGNGPSELQNWSWKDYLMGTLGTVGAGLISKQVLRLSTSQQQKVLEGGFLYLAMKAITTELVPMSATASEWLGEDGNTYRTGDQYVSPTTGETFVLGESGDWRNLSPIPRLVGQTDDDDEVLIGEGLTPVTALGEGLGPVTSLGRVESNLLPNASAGPVWG